MSDTADQLDLASTELLLLLPRLADALERDFVPASDGTKVAGSRELGTPVNAVVLDAVVSLRTEIPAVDARARARLDEGQPTADLASCVAGVKALYLRLQALDPPVACRYADAVFSWQRQARKALGLSQPASELGRTCPLHDQPTTPLLVLGAQGTIHHVQPGTREAISWRRGETIWCPSCRARWAKPEFALLGRMIKDRDQRIEQKWRLIMSSMVVGFDGAAEVSVPVKISFGEGQPYEVGTLIIEEGETAMSPSVHQALARLLRAAAAEVEEQSKKVKENAS